MTKNSSNFRNLFLMIILVKLTVLGLFSSHYQNDLFIPFINHFVSNFDNPWEWVYTTSSSLEFPYHPLMLYTFSLGALIIKCFHVTSIFWTNLLFKFPLFLADLGIFALIYKSVNDKKYSILYYLLSPIIFYATFMHSQLDIVPVAAIFYSFYLLKRQKVYPAAIWCAVAILCKLNAILLVPIFLIYTYKNFGKLKFLKVSVIILSMYLFISAPYIFSAGYKHFVLFNEKQSLFFNLGVNLGTLTIYVPLLCILLIYLKFLSYKKINSSLLDAFCCLAVSTFLIFVPPSSPAWFVWLVPFLSLFVINYSSKNKDVIPSYILLNIVYLIYFLFLHCADFGDLTFLYQDINLKLHIPFLTNCMFTVLEAALLSTIYLTYTIAIKSNAVYKKEQALLIGISGNSGAGKSTLLKDLGKIFGQNMLSLEGDGTHKWERDSDNWQKFTHLDPKANELHQQIETLTNLKNFKTSDFKEYNHKTGKFEIRHQLTPATLITIAGLHTFYLPKMRKLLDLKIYLNTDEEIRLRWKTQRDMKERGHNLAAILNTNKQREKDSLKYITPQKDFADLVITYYASSEKQNLLSLRIDIESNVSLEKLIKYIQGKNIPFQWDYSNDLKMQYLIVPTENGLNNLNHILYDWVENIDEIITKNAKVEKGYRGLIQCIILKMVSERMISDGI